MDVGSAEGFFSRESAKNGNFVFSIEKMTDRISVQKEWVRKYLGAVAICQTDLTVEKTKMLSQVCDFYENTLLLSVLHWMPEPEQIIKNLASCSGKIFVELPDYNDVRACGQGKIKEFTQDQKGWLEKHSGRKVRLVGEPKAHTYETRNLWVIEGEFERSPVRSFWGGELRNCYRQIWKDQKLKMFKGGKELEWTPGVNMETLKQCGVVSPSRDWWKAKLEIESIGIVKHDDLRIWNLIAVYGGVKWIDFLLTEEGKIRFDTIAEDLKSFST